AHVVPGEQIFFDDVSRATSAVCRRRYPRTISRRLLLKQRDEQNANSLSTQSQTASDRNLPEETLHLGSQIDCRLADGLGRRQRGVGGFAASRTGPRHIAKVGCDLFGLLGGAGDVLRDLRGRGILLLG